MGQVRQGDDQLQHRAAKWHRSLRCGGGSRIDGMTTDDGCRRSRRADPPAPAQCGPGAPRPCLARTKPTGGNRRRRALETPLPSPRFSLSKEWQPHDRAAGRSGQCRKYRARELQTPGPIESRSTRRRRQTEYAGVDGCDTEPRLDSRRQSSLRADARPQGGTALPTGSGIAVRSRATRREGQGARQ